eukprot:3391410-Rhodomonas_salina.1
MGQPDGKVEEEGGGGEEVGGRVGEKCWWHPPYNLRFGQFMRYPVLTWVILLPDEVERLRKELIEREAKMVELVQAERVREREREEVFERKTLGLEEKWGKKEEEWRKEEGEWRKKEKEWRMQEEEWGK